MARLAYVVTLTTASDPNQRPIPVRVFTGMDAKIESDTWATMRTAESIRAKGAMNEDSYEVHEVPWEEDS